MSRRTGRKPLWTIVALLLLAAVWFWQERQETTATSAIAEAYASQRSDVWVEASGEVIRLLSDDTEGSAHQRFLVELEDGQTLLFAHNIDLAPRVPITVGDQVAFRGEYEWNDKGGVIHWTHHDPQGRREGGWIEHRGQRFR